MLPVLEVGGLSLGALGGWPMGFDFVQDAGSFRWGQVGKVAEGACFLVVVVGQKHVPPPHHAGTMMVQAMNG